MMPSRLALALLLPLACAAPASAASAAPASAAPASAALAAPAGLNVVAATRPAVTLSWTAGADPKPRYAVERKLAAAAWPPAAAAVRSDARPTSATVAVVDAARVSDETIEPYATYTYRVRALAASGV